MVVYVREIKENERREARALLALALKKEYSLDISELCEEKNEYGKPYFKNHPICFSISHTDGAVAVAVSENNVGVDIERITDISDRVMSRFVKEGMGAECEEKTALWTRYESSAKLIGRGIPIRDEDIERVKELYFFSFRHKEYIITASAKSNEVARLVII